jgi:hypothetical protein
MQDCTQKGRNYFKRIPRHGSKNPAARLNEDQVRAIKTQMASIERGAGRRKAQEALAVAHKVRVGTIRAICEGRDWAHIQIA